MLSHHDGNEPRVGSVMPISWPAKGMGNGDKASQSMHNASEQAGRYYVCCTQCCTSNTAASKGCRIFKQAADLDGLSTTHNTRVGLGYSCKKQDHGYGKQAGTNFSTHAHTQKKGKAFPYTHSSMYCMHNMQPSSRPWHASVTSKREDRAVSRRVCMRHICRYHASSLCEAASSVGPSSGSVTSTATARPLSESVVPSCNRREACG